MTPAIFPGSGPAPGPAPRRLWQRLWRWLALTVVAGLAALIVVAFVGGFGRDPSVVTSALLNRPAPPLAGRTLAGPPFSPATVRGKVLLVNIWASWCPACRAEQRLLDSVQRQLGPAGLQLVGIDMSDTVAAARAFLSQTGGQLYPQIEDPSAHLAVSWGTFGVPETYLVDRAGIIRVKATGALTPGWVRQYVLPVLDRR